MSFITKFIEKPLIKKWAWFILLYLGGIVVVGGFVYLMRFLLGLPS